MPQNLIQMPKDAEFEICGWLIEIRNHAVMLMDGLFGMMMHIIKDEGSDKQTLYQFEKYGVSFEAAIECCAWELENGVDVLARAISDKYRLWRALPKNIGHSEHDFSESAAGRAVADQYIEKIRSCDNWGDLYAELHPTSKFSMDINTKIDVGIVCHKV